MKLRVLGSGTSSGVPRIGNDWGACDPAEPRNRRTRVSFLVETDTTRVLIDTGPDMREQLLSADVATLDAVIWTHDHADHCHGIDDLRQIYHALGHPVRGLARPETLEVLHARFGYVFGGRDGYPPTVAAGPLPDLVVIGDLTIRVVDQPHGRIRSAGLRFEADGATLGIATDFNEMTVDMRTLYQGLDLWVTDTLRRAPHPTHPNLADTLRWVDELRPAHTVLVHMDHSMDYATLVDELPEHIEPGWDGLEIALPIGRSA